MIAFDRRLALRFFGPVALLTIGALAGACAEPHEAVRPSGTVTSGVGGFDAQSSGGGGHAAGGGGAGGTSEPPVPTRLGLEANPMDDGDGEVSPVERLQAELTAYAAGVRSVTMRVDWTAIEEDGGLDTLEGRVADARSRGLEVIVVLVVVDRRQDARPERLRGTAWTDAKTTEALLAASNAIVGRVGEEIGALVFGLGVDVYASAQPDEAAGLVETLDVVTSMLAKGRPTAPIAAVGLSFTGAPMGGVALELSSLGGASAFSYAANLGDESIPNASVPAKDLDGMVATAAGRPIFLVEVSATSAAALGAAPPMQAQRLDAFFAALGPRSNAFRTVNVARLHDLTVVGCAQFAARQGLPVDAPEITFACEAGLRDASGAAKLSWLSFIEASATYALP